jgi:tetratricopeptide (TPR) repeat protein
MHHMRYDEAIDLHRRALAIHERLGDRRNIGPGHFWLGLALSDKGQIGPALVHLRKALAIMEGVLGPDNPHVAYVVDAIGTAFMRSGRPRDAIAPLERAYRIRGGATAPWSAQTAMSLARALWRARRDPRAIELMREAAGFWRTSPRFAAQLATTEAWLASHRPPRPREQRGRHVR